MAWKVFSKKEAFGLDISDSSIEVLQLKKEGDTSSLFAANRVKIKKGLFLDGYILRPDQLAPIIVQLMQTAKPRPIDTGSVVISVPESQVFTHIFRLPKEISNEEVNIILESEAPNVIPLAISDCYSTFKSTEANELEQDIFYAAIDKKIVNGYIDLVNMCGLKIEAIDMETNSLARSLVKEYNNDEVVMVADMGVRTTILSIFNQTGLLFTDNIPIAGRVLTKIIADKLGLPLREAEERKKIVGLDASKDDGQTMLLLQKPIQKLAKELKIRIDYFQQKNNKPIGRLILAGGSALLPELVPYLSSVLNREVELGNPFVNIDLDGLKVDKNMGLLYSSVIGLALRGVNLESEDINFLPKINKT